MINDAYVMCAAAATAADFWHLSAVVWRAMTNPEALADSERAEAPKLPPTLYPALLRDEVQSRQYTGGVRCADPTLHPTAGSASGRRNEVRGGRLATHHVNAA